MARHPQSARSALRPSEVLSDQGSSLGSLLQRAQLLQELQRLLAGAVDPALAECFQVANVHGHRLVLLASTATWATRLRMQTPQLLETARRAGHSDLREVEVRVRPLVKPAAVQRKQRRLSAAAEQALEAMARLGEKGRR